MKPANHSAGRKTMAGGEAGNISAVLIPAFLIACGGWTKICKQIEFVFTGRSGAGATIQFNGFWKQTENKTLYMSTAVEFRAAMN